MDSHRPLERRVLDLLSALGATAVGAVAAVAFFGVMAGDPQPALAEVVPCDCPCLAKRVSAKSPPPIICYDSPGPATNTFMYRVPFLPEFVQVTDFWCRNNGFFAWVNPDQRVTCREDIKKACGLPFKKAACDL